MIKQKQHLRRYKNGKVKVINQGILKHQKVSKQQKEWENWEVKHKNKEDLINWRKERIDEIYGTPETKQKTGRQSYLTETKLSEY